MPRKLKPSQTTPETKVVATTFHPPMTTFVLGSENKEISAERPPSNNRGNDHTTTLVTTRPQRLKVISDYEAAGYYNRDQVLFDIRRKATLTTLYPISHDHFRSMHARVTKARAQGKGDSVCQRWHGAAGFAHFLEDMGAIPQLDRTIDRKDRDDKEYRPDNCWWKTRREQQNNRINTIWVYDPILKADAPLTEAAERNDLSADLIRGRLKRGANPSRVILEATLAKAQKAAHSVSGKRTLTPPLQADQGSNVLDFPAPVPSAPALIKNAKKRLPWPLDDDGKAAWMRLYHAQRTFFDHGWEWPFEFCLRYARERRRAYQQKIHNLADQSGEYPSPEEERDIDQADAQLKHWDNRAREAEASADQWADDIGRTIREDAPDRIWDIIERHGIDRPRIAAPHRRLV